MSVIDDDVPPDVTHDLADAWQASSLVSAATSHAGLLLGASAAATAAAALAWIDGLPPGRADAGDADRAPPVRR